MRYNPSNKEAAQMLRGLREDVDKALEQREPSGSVNLLRGADETAIASDNATATETPAESMFWGSYPSATQTATGDQWGFEEWGNHITLANFEGDPTTDAWREGWSATANASVSSDPANVFVGSQGVVLASTTGGVSFYSPTTTTVQMGDTVRMPAKILNSTSNVYFILGYVDSSNYYLLEHRQSTGYTQMRRIVAGAGTNLGSRSTTDLAGYTGWVVPAINWRDSDGQTVFDVTIFKVDPNTWTWEVGEAFTFTDTTNAFSSGQIGYRVTGPVDTTRTIALDYPHVIHRPGLTG